MLRIQFMLKKYCLFFVFIFFVVGVFAQEKSQNEDLKVGLILSGGGAKGLAHIGALKVIEESGIHIDYIGGTSMGAVIGSLYSVGYSADQLDSIFRKTNFRTLIQDDLPRQAMNHTEKIGAQRYIVTLPFDNFKLTFPSGLSKGQNIYNLLAQLTFPVQEIEDFSELHIPFFCVGTDIESGERLLLDKGSLAQSVAASAAIPSLFKPVIIDDRLVSDGGITDNYAVEEMRKRGMDYIIGVDVQDSLVDRNDLRTVLEIMTQVSNLKTIHAMKEKRPKTDLYIKPDISQFTILSFDKGDEIVDSGEKAARRVRSVLDSLANSQTREGNKQFLKIRDSIDIKNINIDGNESFSRSFVRGKLKLPTDSRVSYEKLNEGLNNLSATGDFERIQYTITAHEDGTNDLNIILTETKNQTNLRFAMHYDGLYKSGALVNFTHKSLLFKNDLISLDMIAAENARYKFNYFIDKGIHWSLGLNSSLNRFDKNVRFSAIKNQFDEVQLANKIPLDYLDLTNQFYAEPFFLNLNAISFRAGFEHKYTKLKLNSLKETETGNPENFDFFDRVHTFGPFGYLEYDSYNHAYFPSKGFYFRGDFHFYLFNHQSSVPFHRYSVLKGRLGWAQPISPKLSAKIETSAGFHLGKSNSMAQNFFLGGFGNDYVNNIVPFFGYSFLAKSGNNFIKSSIELDYEAFKKSHFILGYNIANIGDDLLEDGRLFNVPDYSAFYLGYGMDTFVGPLQIYYSISPETTRSRWFVSLGFWF